MIQASFLSQLVTGKVLGRVRFAKSPFLGPHELACDLKPFGSIFLILRRVGVGTRAVPTCFPSSPEGKTLATYLPSAFRIVYSCSVKVPQRWQRNERSH